MLNGSFEVLHTEGHARRGRLSLAHGVVETPVFMPVGTYGAVKGVEPATLKSLGTQILLGNAYHLHLRPGPELLQRFGGLHTFMGWDRPILTDSGGFQAFSLAAKMSDEGMEFRSHHDGARVFLTPERSAEVQQAIGSDIAMVLDDCPALPAPDDRVRLAVERSAAWAQRFLAVPRRPGQKIFGIVQGGTDAKLRQESLERTLALPFDGLALGGFSVGEPHEAMVEALEAMAPTLPAASAHYLMGVGTPIDLLEAVRCGLDMFDCVLPTRNARNGGFFTDQGLLNIRNARFKEEAGPVDPTCQCEACIGFSAGYLRHLFQQGEMLGCRLATIHNLHYYHRLMSQIRSALEVGGFARFYGERKDLLAKAYLKRRPEDA